MAAEFTKSTNVVEKEPEQEAATPDEVLEFVVRNALTGDGQHLQICRRSTLRDLQAVLHSVFGVPPFEQILLNEDGAIVLGDGRFDDTRPVGSVPKLGSGASLMLLRRLDARPQAEKNAALVSALREGKLEEAMNVLDSNGAAVDPNCVGSFAHDGPGFLTGGPGARDYGDIRSARMPALCMAVMARCTWCPAGEVTGELADDASVVRMVERLLAMGASVDELQDEVLTCGSWPEEVASKTALYLAVQTRSVALVRLLLDAGADPTRGLYTRQFHPGTSMPCERALQQQADDPVTQELLGLLRRKEYTVKISCPDEPSLLQRLGGVLGSQTSAPLPTLGIAVSRRGGFWGFVDDIEPNGLVARWNQHHSGDGQVRVNDKIVAVCGHRAGVDCREGTAFLVDEERGWTDQGLDKQGDCFLAHLLSRPEHGMVLTLTRAGRP
mmetsp:Transcript_24607/g.69159  ORF Transcript_24607/g.69159 Transcript_24607/m.69159 type:complete len:440 (+) Transcript_24607:79-1398(+)